MRRRILKLIVDLRDDEVIARLWSGKAAIYQRRGALQLAIKSLSEALDDMPTNAEEARSKGMLEEMQ